MSYIFAFFVFLFLFFVIYMAYSIGYHDALAAVRGIQ